MTQTNKLNVGDTVRCADASGLPITYGKDYLVQGFTKDVLGEWVRIQNDDGISGSYRAGRFVIKTKAEDNSNKQGDNVNKFVETQTIKTIKTVIDGTFTNYARISVKPHNSRSIKLVIGAEFENRIASTFDKKSLLELAKTLTELAEALED